MCSRLHQHPTTAAKMAHGIMFPHMLLLGSWRDGISCLWQACTTQPPNPPMLLLGHFSSCFPSVVEKEDQLEKPTAKNQRCEYTHPAFHAHSASPECLPDAIHAHTQHPSLTINDPCTMNGIPALVPASPSKPPLWPTDYTARWPVCLICSLSKTVLPQPYLCCQ